MVSFQREIVDRAVLSLKDAGGPSKGPEGAFVLEILIRSRWVKVPKGRILPLSSPDGGVHACYSDPAPFMTEMMPGLVIRCVIVGGLT